MNISYEYLDAVEALASRILTNDPRLLQTQVPTFRGTKDNLNEFEHLLKNNFRPINHRVPKEPKRQCFQSLLREEAIEFLSVTNDNDRDKLN